jgi:mxaL protein
MMNPLRDLRLGLLLAALVGLAIALAKPSWTLPRAAYDFIVVVDITGSMNARDYVSDGHPMSRLEAAKRGVRDLIAQLACRSRVGLGVFSERRSFLLFAPVELCDNFSAVDGAVAALDWRMAWEGDSHVASGLHRAMETAGDLGVDLVFLTDGQEAPPLPASGHPAFEGERGKVRGLVVGVGGTSLVPIPKFDDKGHEIGFWGVADVPHENRSGPPPADASNRPGWHPRNAPFGGAPVAGNEHLTSVREAHLQTLARETGLAYVRLTGETSLQTAVAAQARPREIETSVDLRPIPAGVALAALVAVFAVLPVIESRRMRRRFLHSSTVERKT